MKQDLNQYKSYDVDDLNSFKDVVTAAVNSSPFADIIRRIVGAE